MELARLKPPLPPPVEFSQCRQHNRMYRDIDPYSQCIRPADHGQKPVLGKLFHHPPVPRKHACMMDTDAIKQQAF